MQIGGIMANNSFKIEGMEELQKSLTRLGKTPQKHVNSAATRGMQLILKDAKASAPFDTGELKKGIIKIGEGNHTKAKKMYQIVFDRSMNDIFQKPNTEGKVTGYYPVSQEYGFFAKNGRFIPGYHFIHQSMEDKAPASARLMVSVMKKKIDTQIAKEGLK